MRPSVRSVPWSLLWLAAGLLTSHALNLVPNPDFAAGSGTRPEAWTKVGFLERTAFGHALPTADDLALWWCEGGWKVGRHTPAPTAPNEDAPPSPVRLTLARGEYEPAQVVMRPAHDTRLIAADPSGMRGPDGRPSSLTLTIDEVAYVQVVRPTDGSGVPGWYPDPLPPLRLPLALRAGEKRPLWLTVHSPPGAAAGEHRGELILRTDRGEARIPLVVKVYDFDLPGDTHLQSALGLGMQGISRDLTHFTTDPRPILEQRDRIARAIVALRSVR